jgi:hypothetical protein
LGFQFAGPQSNEEAAADVIQRETLRRAHAMSVKPHVRSGWLGRDPGDLAQQLGIGRCEQRRVVAKASRHPRNNYRVGAHQSRR